MIEKIIKLPVRFLICVFMSVVLGCALVIVSVVEWAMLDKVDRDLTNEIKFDLKHIWRIVLCRK